MILRNLINFMISLNVFAGYFAKKYWSSNTNFSEDYTKGTGLITYLYVTVQSCYRLQIILLQLRLGYSSCPYILLGSRYSSIKKINWSVNHFDESGFKDYFFLFWIYLIVGLGSLFMLSAG